MIDESRALGIPAEKPESIPSLAMTAAYNGYAVIVLDAPPSSIAPAAIMAANTLILVARPTASGAQRTARRPKPVGLVQVPVARLRKIVRAVVHIEQHGFETLVGAPQHVQNVALERRDPRIAQRPASQRGQRALVPS